MSFLNLFLAGFAALGAVPIIIHLLNQRRFKVVVWAAMEFLLATIEKNSRRLQLRDLILMLLRTFAVVFLALALARPTISPGGLSFLGKQGETAAVIVLDNSLSMGYEIGNATRFAAAKAKAKEILDSLPKGSGAALVLMSDIALDEIPEPSHDLAFVAGEIERAPLSDGGTDVNLGLAKAWKIAKSATAVSREIYLISDMQANAWPAADNPRWSRIAEEIAKDAPAVKLFLANVGDDAVDNLNLESLLAEDDLITTESDVAFTATLRNDGATSAKNVTVDLLVGGDQGGDLRKAASQVVDSIEPGAVRQVRLETRFTAGGNHRVAVRSGLDHLVADNSRYLAVNVIDRIRVLLIDGRPAEPGEKFGGATDFLRAALSPADTDIDGRKELIECEVVTVAGLADKTLRDYQVVILADVGDISDSLAEGLKTFVKAEGKGLMVFLGENISPQRYNQLLSDKTGLLPGRIGAQVIEGPAAVDAKDRGFGIATDELSHPIVSFFKDKETAPYLAQPRFYKAWPIEIKPEDLADKPLADKTAVKPGDKPAAEPPKPVDPKADAKGAKPADGNAEKVSVVARFVTGQPAIAERKVGRGTVLLFASSADKSWSDFPLRPAFVMVVRRAAQLVALGRQPSKTVQVNDPIADLLGVKESGVQVAVRDPRGSVRQVTAALTPSGDLARVEYADTHFAGFYELSRGKPAQVTFFAANPPRIESNLEALGEDALRAKYPTLKFHWISKNGDLRQLITEERVGREIWFILLALTIACLLVESFLAVRWAPKGV